MSRESAGKQTSIFGIHTSAMYLFFIWVLYPTKVTFGLIFIVAIAVSYFSNKGYTPKVLLRKLMLWMSSNKKTIRSVWR